MTTTRSVDSILRQAALECWDTLALGHDEDDERYFRERGWDGARIFILDQQTLDLGSIAPCSSLRRLGIRKLGLGENGARALSLLGDLTSLYLSKNALGSEGARALSSLSGLTALDIRTNQIGERGARALCSLTGLSSLNLSNNSIGERGARALSSLTGLSSLYLRANGIGSEGARALSSLSSLTSLDLSNNGIGESGARALSSLRHLTVLNCSNNGLGDEGARALSSLRSLTSLKLNHNRIGEPGARALASLQRLKTLHFSHNNIGNEGARSLASLGKLTSLFLSHSGIEEAGARALASLSSLTSLYLRHNAIGDEGARALASLSGLTSLYLRNNAIGNEGARALSVLNGLTFLDLSNNAVGDEGAQALSSLGDLTSLDLRTNEIGEGGARALSSLGRLTSLDLSNNGVGDAGARALSALSSLTSLGLSNNGIGDEGARALSSLSRLTSLDLGNNSIGEEGARALSSLDGLATLYLRNNGVGDEGARALSLLSKLASLDLSNNEIGSEGARALSSLNKLTSLGLNNNEIGSEGARALSSLSKLASLGLNNSGISDEGARALSSLGGLAALYLRNNRIGDEGAGALSSLSTLNSLDLRNNWIGDEGARALSSLSGLHSLSVSDNGIGNEGARALSLLGNLQSLLLRNNGVGDAGARALSGLSSLTSLDLANNEVGNDGALALLAAWRDAPSPQQILVLGGNSISFLPKEVLTAPHAPTILAAFDRYELSLSAPLNEAKLLVVGNEAVGKTSLIRYLIHNKSRDLDEEKTPGIVAHERIETHAWSPDGDGPSLNVWDFGGQEIMHETHKFFLTERSVYLLVLEDRREDDTSIYKWLRTIANRGGDSPVLVVINKCDGGQPKLLLDETTLARDWPSIVGFIRTSCNPGEHAKSTIERLKATIVQTLTQDPRLIHVRDPIPEPWRRVKDSIAMLAREQKVLNHQDFVRLCLTQEGTDAITKEPEQRALLHLLNDLGVIVAYGLDDGATAAALREVRLLDPNWLTGAIYKVLTAGLIVKQGGMFRRDQLAELLHPEEYPKARWEFILSMMQLEGVGLCFPLAGSTQHEYLVPEALSKSAPALIYDNWPDDSLRFRFDYEYLPSGLVPRFIVEAHTKLTNTRWRGGAVLDVARCQALVMGSVDKKRVDILVCGPLGLRRSALGLVLHDLKRVHALNPQIKPSAKVPLPDNSELAVSYEHLVKLEARFGPDYEYPVEGANRDYRVGDLLDGVRRSRATPPPRTVEPTPRLPSPDVLLVVTTDVEFQAIEDAAKAITGRDYEEHFGRIRTYYDFGTIKNARVFVVQTEMGAAGPGGSLSVIKDAILELRLGSASGRAPASVIAVGIAFGIDEDKQAIGDILVSRKIRDYEPERVGKGEIIPRGNRSPASTRLLDRIKNASKRLRDLKVRFGLVLSGEKLVDNLDYRRSLQDLEPEAIGGEMEGTGLVTACHDGGTEWLVVKAICDWGDGHKRDDKAERQTLAAQNAATLVLTALSRGGFSR